MQGFNCRELPQPRNWQAGGNVRKARCSEVRRPKTGGAGVGPHLGCSRCRDRNWYQDRAETRRCSVRPMRRWSRSWWTGRRGRSSRHHVIPIQRRPIRHARERGDGFGAVGAGDPGADVTQRLQFANPLSDQRGQKLRPGRGRRTDPSAPRANAKDDCSPAPSSL